MARLAVAASLAGDSLTAQCPVCSTLCTVRRDVDGAFTRKHPACEHLSHAVDGDLVFRAEPRLPRTTPGPWFVRVWPREGVVDGSVAVVTDSRGHGLMESSVYGRNARAAANMRMAAAAPELYAALAEVVLESTKSTTGRPSHTTIQRALNVLRKAGEV